MSKTLMFIGAGPYQLPGIQRAKEMGIRTIAVDGAPSAPGLAVADLSAVVDVRDAAACESIARSQSVDGVLTIASDAAVRSVASVAEHLGLPGITTESALRVTDKQLMRAAFTAAGLEQPRTAAVHSGGEAVAQADAIGYPVVVKPADSAGSRGVTFVSDSSRVPDAFDIAQRYATGGKVLIEEFVEGVESSVEGFVVGGELRVVALSDKMRTDPPHLLDRTVVFPSLLDGTQRRSVEKMAQSCVRSVGVTSGPIHLEYLHSPKGLVPVEIAARGPGFKVFSDIIPFVSGVDVLAAAIQDALGMPVDVYVTRSLSVAIGFIESPEAGILSTVGGVDEALAIEGVTEVDIYAVPGDQVRQLASGSDRIGHIIVRGQEREAVLKALDRARSLIGVKLR